MLRPVTVVLAVLSSLAAQPARADEAAAARLAAQPAFKAVLEARDHVANRSFTATVIYAGPGLAFASLPPDDFVHVGGGAITVREVDPASKASALRRTDVAAWMRATAAALAPTRADLDALAPGAPAAPDLGALAGRLGVTLNLEMRRREDRVTIALVLGLGYDAALAGAPGFVFTGATAGAETTYGPSGFPQRIVLRGPTGRVDAEVETTRFEPLGASAADAAMPAGTDIATAIASDPSPRLKDRIAADVLRPVLGRLRAAAARDETLLDRAGARARDLLATTYAALFRAGFAEEALRGEARRVIDADGAVVRAAVAGVGEPRRREAEDALRDRFTENCRVHFRYAIAELLRIAEAALPPPAGATADALQADDAARSRLLGLSADAALEAFERAIVAPMSAEATTEIDKLASAEPKKGDSRP